MTKDVTKDERRKTKDENAQVEPPLDLQLQKTAIQRAIRAAVLVTERGTICVGLLAHSRIYNL